MSAAPVTVLNIVNKVMARLREDTLGALSDSDYGRTVLQLLNDAKREVEDAFNWSALRNTIDVSAVQGTSTYSVSDGASNYTNQRSRLVEVYNSTTDQYLTQIPRDHLRRLRYDDDQENEPIYYSIDGYDSDQNIQIEIHPIPDTSYTLKCTAFTPQEDFSVATGGSQTISVPWMPVYLRTLSLALRERGDDEGTSFGEAFQDYIIALNDAIAYEQRASFDNSFDGDWHVVGNGF